MKKLVLAVGLGLLSGSLYAACVGTFCYDDSGVSGINANLVVNGVVGMSRMTKATIATSTPTITGMVFCTDCASGGGAGAVCFSTSTTGGNSGVGSYFILSTGTVCK